MRYFWYFAPVLFLLNSCSLSFKGIVVPEGVESFYIESLEDITSNSPPMYTVNLAEDMSNKFRKDSRLKYIEQGADMVFNCKVIEFGVSSQAANAEGYSSLNRLTISLEVESKFDKDEKKSWKKNFTRYVDYDANINFDSESERLTKEVNALLIQDVFNVAFSNW
ncbi:MAG: hypothetical protein IPJ64_04410 [Saprospiraceae bacterium]|nr:hypothetical protein [Saprospiraceae bacterium]MBK7795600.1 hypothetical protein [Saprospiraceae bacterium]